MEIHTIGVCGAGTMGRGITLTLAQAGYSTLLFDLNPDILASARAQHERELESLVQKGKLTADKKERNCKTGFTPRTSNWVALF